MSGTALEQRRLPSWTDAFLEFTEPVDSPAVFRKWAAIATISAALERKVWTRSRGSDLFANVYVILVGPPGVGKSAVLSQAERLLRAVPDIHIAPSSVTTASLADVLKDSTRRIVRPTENPPYVEFNHVTVLASELGVFLPVYDGTFMNMLTKLYDGEEYSERRRTKDLKLKIAKPLLTLIGGTTPSYLNTFMPEGAWDQGFASRTILVYSSDKIVGDIWADPAKNKSIEQLHIDLLNDLKIIAKLHGQITWDPDAAAALTAWHKSGGKPLPEHSRLIHYNTRRTAHLLKLSMVSAVSTGNQLGVSLADFDRALEWLIEAETYMPDIFQSVSSSGDATIMENAWNFLRAEAKRTGNEWVAEHRLVSFLRERAPAHNIINILRVMNVSRMIEMGPGTYRAVIKSDDTGPLLRKIS